MHSLRRQGYRGILAMWAASALAVLAPVSARAQAPATAPAAPTSPYDGRPIRELNITGLQSIQESYARNLITSRAGQTYSQATVERDVSRLLRQGWFNNVQAESALVDGQINLTFVVSEKPRVAAIEFIGNQKFKAKDLLDALSFGVGDALDLFDVRRGREAIERLYREKGYANVEVSIDEGALNNEQRVVYNITENQRIRVRSIRFEGNTAFRTPTLRSQLATKTYFPIFRTGDFDQERVERDAATVQQYYRDRGYLDAQVGYETSFEDVARERMRVTFRINEGTLYNVKEIHTSGNSVFTQDEILAAMRLQAGDPFNSLWLQADVKALVEEKYGAQGYIETRIERNWVFAEEPGLVVVTLEISEGEQFRLGWVEVNGNLRTQEKTVRRELHFDEPGALYNLPETRKAEARLRDTGLFSDAAITPIVPENNAPGVRDAVVTVTENPRTNNFIAGVGASSDNGLVGNIVLENTNFDLFDPPRTWGEFFRGRSLRGAGQTARIQFEPGTEFTRFRLDFREPYMFYKPIGFDTSFYLYERERDAYTEKRIGGTFGFDQRFESGPLKGWTGDISIRTEYVIVDDVDSFPAHDIRSVKGGSYLSTAKLSMLHDTTDSRFDPSKGHRFRVAWEQAGALGGDYTFGKFTAEHTQHFTITTDDEGRKGVLSLHANAGQIFGDAPVFERFYAGGIGSFRGFDYRGISPRDGLKHNRVGGDFTLLAGGEYSFPLVAKAIRGVTFLDMGTVERDFGISTWRAAVGVGVRLKLDIFGTVPMEFDLAFPLSTERYDNERIFSFFIGLPFF